MQYDVFISCKSEDYQCAEEIYEFLEANGIHTFLASKELRKLGDSEYRKAISAALKSSYHMLIFASQKEYIDSTWVYYEWDWFVNAQLKGFKPGQIVTVLKDIHMNDINADLWKYQSFTFDDYKDGLLSYVETSAYLQRKDRLEKKKEEEEHIKRQQEELLNKQKEAKQELIALAEEYRKKVADLNSVDAKKLVAALRAIGVDTHACPVCNTDVDVAKSYCPTCGWTISPIDDIEGAEYLSLVNERQMNVVRAMYSKCIDLEQNIKRKNLSRLKLLGVYTKIKTSLRRFTSVLSVEKFSFRNFFNWLKGLKKRYFIHLLLLCIFLPFYFVMYDGALFIIEGVIAFLCIIISSIGIIQLLKKRKDGLVILCLNSVLCFLSALLYDCYLDAAFAVTSLYLLFVLVLFLLHRTDRASELSWNRMISSYLKHPGRFVGFSVLCSFLFLFSIPIVYAKCCGLDGYNIRDANTLLERSYYGLRSGNSAKKMGSYYTPRNFPYPDSPKFDGLRTNFDRALWWYCLAGDTVAVNYCNQLKEYGYYIHGTYGKCGISEITGDVVVISIDAYADNKRHGGKVGYSGKMFDPNMDYYISVRGAEPMGELYVEGASIEPLSESGWKLYGIVGDSVVLRYLGNKLDSDGSNICGKEVSERVVYVDNRRRVLATSACDSSSKEPSPNTRPSSSKKQNAKTLFIQDELI